MASSSPCSNCEYRLLNRVRVGSHSAVNSALHMCTQQVVIVKMLSWPNKLEDSEKFDQEVAALKSLDHRNVVKVLDGHLLQPSIPIFDGPHFELRSLLVTEFCAGGDLWQWLMELEDLGQTTQLRMFEQIVNGVNYLHERSLCHGDLQPSNVLFHGGRPMLCGFGLTRDYDEDDMDLSRSLYAAPECININRLLCRKNSDVFSLAIILVQLHTDVDRFEKWIINRPFAYDEFLSKSPFMEFPDRHCLTDNMQWLLGLMLSPLRENRIDVKIVKNIVGHFMNRM